MMTPSPGGLWCLLTLLCLSPAGGPAVGDEASFAVPLKTARDGDQVRIDFTATGPTDAAVYILDAQGKVVCHLAAGVIGGRSVPPAPLKAGLAQSLKWDLRDDAGKPAAGGPFKVRVRLGMKPEFDGFLLDNPAATGGVTDVAVGPGGNMYLWHRDNTANGNQGSNKLKVIGRDGKYRRTLMPYPADLPKEKARVFGALTDTDGSLVPRIYNLQQLTTTDRGYGARGRTMSSSGCVDSAGRVYWLMANARLAAIDANGAPLYGEALSKPLLPDFPAVTGWGSLAVSGDGKFLYIAGLGKAKNQYDRSTPPASCIWRIDLATLKAETFVGDPAKPGKERELLTEPRTVAVGKGLLYVADRVADRIAIFKEADRSFAGEIKIKSPTGVGTDPASGAVYVVAHTGKETADLVKFVDGKEVCRVALPKSGSAHRIAVDASAKPVRIVLPTLRWQGQEIYCYEDAGDKIAAVGDPRDLKGPWAAGPRDLTVDRTRGELYVKFGVQKYYRLDCKTGKVLSEIKMAGVAGPGTHLDSAGTQLVVSPDGSLVSHSWGAGLRRLDRDGKPLNWTGRNTNAIPFGGIMTFQERYMVMPNPEELFIILPPSYRGKKGSFTSLNVLGTDGTTRRTVIWQCTQGAVPRIDSRGNIYIADMVKPPDRSYPEFFDGQLEKYVHSGSPVDALARDPDAMSRFWESSMYGSIIKFPPSGGIIWYDKDLPESVEGKPSAELLAKPKTVYGRHIGYNFKPVEVQGAEWVRFGFSPFGEARGAGFCMCEGVGFDVDDFGRVFYPNLGQFRVEMVDTSNNWIGTFGRYGTHDSSAKGQIPLAWPTYVAVSDDYAFVNDTISNRVVRVKLGAQSEQIVDVR